MSKLARVEAVRTRAGLPDTDAVNSLLGQMLDAASIHLESLLRTSFVRGVYTDTFEVDDADDRHKIHNKFYLRNGYVDAADVGQPLEVRAASTLLDVPTADLCVVTETYTFDEVKGLVMFVNPCANAYPNIHAKRSLRANFVEVKYTSGFEEGSGGFGKFYKNVPTYLQEAATQLAIKMFFESGGCGIKDPVKDRAKLFSLENLLEPYIRWYPSAVKPLL